MIWIGSMESLIITILCRFYHILRFENKDCFNNFIGSRVNVANRKMLLFRGEEEIRGERMR